MPPRYHATPAEALTEIVRDTVYIADSTYLIDRPTDWDKLLDHPWVRSAYAADEYVPYWAQLWPAARMLAKVMTRENWGPNPGSLHVLEIGCGLGLAGIATLARGLKVTFSDVDETAVDFAAKNARLNGFTAFRTMLLDFRAPPSDRKYPVVIGSDLMYEERLVEPLIGLLEAVLAPGGTCLITDPDRSPARHFRWKLAEAGYDVKPELIRAGEPGGERTKGTLYRIRHGMQQDFLGGRERP
jgi:predicted nicotinamide N-methyase